MKIYKSIMKKKPHIQKNIHTYEKNIHSNNIKENNIYLIKIMQKIHTSVNIQPTQTHMVAELFV